MRAVAVTSAIAAIGLVWAATPSPADPPPSFVSRNCVACHNSRVKSGELDLQTLASEPVASHREKWERVLQRVERGEMPPKGMPRPAPQDLASFRSGLETEFARLDRDAGPNPGRVTARRLNRYEYNNTIRDLTGLDIHPADDFPADNSGYGFDNNGDVLSISPVLMEKYFAAAEKVAELAIVTNGPLPESHIRIISCGHAPGQHDANCARTVLTGLERRAYRRPPTDAEVTKLLQLVNQAQRSGDSFEQSMRLGLEAVLVSPHFLFRIEQDPAEGQHRLSDYELAARLSYFVWSSMPDDELSRIAGRGGLRDPNVLAAQVRRMLADPKAKALAENFAGQWLETRNLKYHKPDPEKFPAFNRELRDDMLRETEMFFNAVVVEDRSILDFIDAPFTFLNERLAKHYGIDGVTGPEFRRVALSTPQRSGILTQASVLIVSVVSEPHVARNSGQMGSREYSQCSAATAAARCAEPGRRQVRRVGVPAPATGKAPRKRRLRLLPSAHGPARLRSREL